MLSSAEIDVSDDTKVFPKLVRQDPIVLKEGFYVYDAWECSWIPVTSENAGALLAKHGHLYEFRKGRRK